MKYGLTSEQYQLLNKICLQPLKEAGAKVWIFGSRARGDNHQYSDIDLLYHTNRKLRLGFIGEIEFDLKESRLPYKVDLVDLASLAESYKEGVLKDRIEI